MSPPQADKAGLHILLKLAALVIILAGIHAAADILVQLLLALFFAIVLNPLVTGSFAARGAASVRHYPGGDGDAGDAHRAARRAGGVAQ